LISILLLAARIRPARSSACERKLHRRSAPVFPPTPNKRKSDSLHLVDSRRPLRRAVASLALSGRSRTRRLFASRTGLGAARVSAPPRAASVYAECVVFPSVSRRHEHPDVVGE